MMTSVLRDSLGGNCMTTMIATVSVEKKNLDESISTCRFAQRVAMIKNDAILNEELDPKLMIQRLKREIAQLKDELAMATGDQRSDELSPEDVERCQEIVDQFLQDSDIDATINIGADMRKIQLAFKIIKKAYLNRQPTSARSSRTPVSEATPRAGQPSHYDQAEDNKLKTLLIQRDNEINILVNMLKKEKKRAADAVAGRPITPRTTKTNQRSVSSNEVTTTTTQSYQRKVFTNDVTRGEAHNGANGSYSAAGVGVSGSAGGMARISSSGSAGGMARISSSASVSEEPLKRQVLGELSMGRQEAFETYRRDYPHQQTIEDNKRDLKQRYAQAKSLGEKVNTARTKINKLKASIEQHRMSRVMQGLVDADNPEPDDIEYDMRQQLEEEKQNYKGNFTQLRTLKTEIEHLQHLLERSKVKLMKDFEIWWAEEASRVQDHSAHIRSLPGVATNKSAWRTPPVTPQSQSDNTVMSSISAQSSRTSLLSEPSSQSRPIARGSSSQLAPISSQHSSNSRRQSETSGYSSSASVAADQSRGDTTTASAGGIPLTGDAQADADIMAFVKARQTVASHMTSQGKR